MRRVRTRVLPDPAPATMHSGVAEVRDRVALLGGEVFEQDIGVGEAFGHDVTLPTQPTRSPGTRG